MTRLHPPLQLTTKHHEILLLLYRFRFLTRLHIQTLLNHSHHSYILTLLKHLTDHSYITRDYQKQFTTRPAIYSLGKEGRKFLKRMEDTYIKPGLLDRVWREQQRSEEFKQHCLSIADIYLSVHSLTAQTKATLHFYTKTDLHGIPHLISPLPDAYFAIEETSGSVKRCFLDLFDDVPPKVLRNRARQYFSFFESSDWQDHTNKPFPEILLICPNKRLRKHLYYNVQSKLESLPTISFYLASHEEVKLKKLSKETLQRVTERE